MTVMKKVVFKLEQDEDGYPPASSEGLWAVERAQGEYQIDNVPFFVKGISNCDVVSVRLGTSEEVEFDRVIRRGGHSTLRLIFFDKAAVESTREWLREQGCSSEQSHLPSLIAVDIPAAANFEEVQRYFNEGEAAGKWEYEEGFIYLG